MELQGTHIQKQRHRPFNWHMRTLKVVRLRARAANKRYRTLAYYNNNNNNKFYSPKYKKTLIYTRLSLVI